MSEFYGLPDWETLPDSVEDVIERLLDEACECPGEGTVLCANRITWPVKVHVFRRCKVAESQIACLAAHALDDALERLGEEYGDPDGDANGPTDAMREAATTFARTVVAEYNVWLCEPTGEVVEVSRAEAMEMCGGVAAEAAGRSEA